jgi:hypothetical protein
MNKKKPFLEKVYPNKLLLISIAFNSFFALKFASKYIPSFKLLCSTSINTEIV